MRLACLVLLMFLFPACAMRPTAPSPAVQAEPEPEWELDDAQPAAALALDPPALQAEPPLDFPRDSRAQGAFWGIQGPRETYFYQRIDDRYGTGWGYGSYGDLYRERTIETTVGTSVR
jgi:hypothetical protein